MKSTYVDYFTDIKDSILKIENFVLSFNFDQFANDEKTLFAVIRAFEIIGEAANNIPEETRKLFPNIPWQLMIAMRNKLIHEYFGIDTRIVRNTIKEDIPIVKKTNWRSNQEFRN